MILDMSPGAIDARLREASRLAGSLHPAARLTTKVDLGGGTVSQVGKWQEAKIGSGGEATVVELRANHGIVRFAVIQ